MPVVAVKKQTARAELAAWRRTFTRKSLEVLRHYARIKSSLATFGAEQWDVYEQVALAALDCGGEEASDVFSECIAALRAQFPDSTRVSLLQGRKLEAEGKFGEAQKLYNDVLEADETNMTAQQRIVALLVQQRKLKQAVDKLNEYLKMYGTDQQAWQQLLELYLKQGMVEQAAFCAEELVLMAPLNHVYNRTYAEVLYTLGDDENVRTARRYFAQALKLCPGNARALCGLHLASRRAGKTGQLLQKESANQLRQVLDDAGATLMAKRALEGL
eukprot:UC1_evm1s2133